MEQEGRLGGILVDEKSETSQSSTTLNLKHNPKHNPKPYLQP